MNNLLKGTEKLFGNNYNEFCRDLLLSAEYDEMPVVFQLNNTFGITFQDICDLYRDVKKDTNFELTANIFMCHECNQLHLEITVDYSDREEEEDNIYLQ